jgi:hypothetical protein
MAIIRHTLLEYWRRNVFGVTNLALLTGDLVHLQGKALILYPTVSELLLMTYLDLSVNCLLYLLLKGGFLVLYVIKLGNVRSLHATYLTLLVGLPLL